MNKISKGIALAFLSIFIAACSGGGSRGGGTPGTDGTVTPIGDLSGQWNITETIRTSSCGKGDIGTSIRNTYNVTQNNSSISVTTTGKSFSGLISGNNVSMTGSNPEDGGTTAASIDLTVGSSCNTISGSSTWGWSGSGTSCSGTTELRGTRTTATGCGNTGSTIPKSPSGFQALATSDSSISLSWRDNADNESGYKIYRSTSPSSGFGSSPVITTGSGAYRERDNFGLIPDTTYYYRIYAYNNAGQSTGLVTASAKTNPMAVRAPDKPATFTATALSSSSIRVNWSNVARESGYNVDYKLSTSSAWSNTIVSRDVTTKTFSSLRASSTYNFRIRAYNSAGSSVYAYVNKSTTAATLPTPVLSAPSTSTGSIALSWTFNWGGSLVTSSDGYELQESSTSSTSGYTRIYSTLFTGDHTTPKSYRVNKTVSGTYYYRVRAYKNTVYSPWSSVARVSVTVSSSGKLIIRVINDLISSKNSTGYELNQMVSVKIAPTGTSMGAYGSAYEKLRPGSDSTNSLLNVETIKPGYLDAIVGGVANSRYYKDFDVTSLGPNYSILVAAGWWERDLSAISTRYDKHVTVVSGCARGSSVLKGIILNITSHTSANTGGTGIYNIKLSDHMPDGGWYGTPYCK